eukprot:TRINITY_DN448_c0_g1_i1.p1 TRINITY_DN448_c0_g1~~TRINITY_DN448_c0_g1_i1.p1  ORF type:complete len:947 (+),score=150.37 TRINITY_DN448_c0_g1_i1:3051-5891(+)
MFLLTLTKTQVSKQKIDRLKILRLTKLLVVLTGGKVVVLNPATLEEKAVLVKSGASTFAVNGNDYIAVAVSKKVLFYFFDLQKVTFLPLTLTKSNEMPLHEQVNKMVWNNDILGVVTKKNYIIIDPKTIKVQELCPLNNTLYPHLLVFKGSWVLLTADSIMLFENKGRPIPSGSIEIQATSKHSPIYQLAVLDYYLVCLKDFGANIYNLLDFTKVQEIPFEKGWAYRTYAIDGYNLFIARDVPTGSKKELASALIYLMCIPYEEQIKRLLKRGSIQEAFKVFEQNNPKSDPNYEAKEERFKLEAAWALLINLAFSKAIEIFLQVNYDPRELLALVPGLLKGSKSYKSLRDLIEEKDQDSMRLSQALKEAKDSLAAIGPDAPPEQKQAKEEEVLKLTQALKDAKDISASKIEQVLTAGKKAIIKLIEEKRKRLEGKYDLSTDLKKHVTFLNSEKPINVLKMPKIQTLDEIMELLDTCLLKLFVEEREVNQLYNFINRTTILKCNEKEMDTFLEERKDKDRSFTAHACQALLEDRSGNYANALKIWKTLGQETREVRDMACKETARILKTKADDKKIITTYARMLLVVNPEEGLKIFTETEGITKVISEDDTLTYLEGLETYQPQLRERYLEYLINRKDSQEHFYTLLALLYVSRIRSAMEKNRANTLSSPEVTQNRKTLSNFLKGHTKYNPTAVLDEIKGLNLFEEEIYLYCKQKKYEEALSSYIKMGSEALDFTQAEEFCNDNSQPLFAVLFEKIITMYNECKERLSGASPRGIEQDYLEKRAKGLENYCKSFLKRHATNEKLDAEAVLKAIPEDWGLIEEKDDDDSLLQYLTMTFNDRLGKEISTKIARKANEMQRLDLEGKLINLQRAYVVMSPENICKVCRKKLAGGRSYYVFPNGTVTHTTCAKDIRMCPVTKVNFAKKVYVQPYVAAILLICVVYDIAKVQ